MWARYAAASLVALILLPPRNAVADPASRQVGTNHPPSWVATLAASRLQQTDQHDLPGGQSLALFDQQVNAATAQCFVHVVKDIVTETGVQSGANLTISFDPSYQNLTLHEIVILRGTQRLDRLNLAAVKLIQQETDLDRQIYNGALSAVIFLDDVRVDDRIDYSYTLGGENPALKHHYAGSYGAGFSVPVQRLRYRLLLPTGRNIQYKAYGIAAAPAIQRHGGLDDYVWDWRDVHATLSEDQVPPWFPVYPWVQVSDFKDWGSVTDWAVGLYASTNGDSTALRQCIESIRNPELTAERQIEEALRFVQTNVRYLGIEFGPSSYQPTDPAVVLQRRFGDCKDKAFLLCEILRRLGIEADPALVGTGFLHTVADMLPSPYNFDHVIVRVQAGPRVYWVDPTRTYQRGALIERFVPDYGWCLLIRPGEVALSSIPPSSSGFPETVTVEDYLCAAQKRPARLEAATTATGLDAERMRATIASLGRDGYARAWLNDYSRRYPGISLVGPLRIDDSPDHDAVRIAQSYVITNFWVRSTDGRTYTCEFLPQGIQAWIEKPSTTIRTMPIGLSYPRRRTVISAVHLPGDWPLTNSNWTIASAAARLAVTRTWRNGTLMMTYDYQTLTNMVSGPQADEYFLNLDRMNDKIGYKLTWPSEEFVAGQSRMNWPILIVAALYGLLLCAAMVTILKRLGPQKVADSDLAVPSDLAGLRGWLVLVALGLGATALSCVVTMLRTYGSYARPVWVALTDVSSASYHPGWLPLLMGELLTNITIVFLDVFLLILFFQRRRLFPRAFVFYLLFILNFSILDGAGATMMKSVLPAQTLAMAWKATIRAVGACALWIPYALVSKRVKATFVR